MADTANPSGVNDQNPHPTSRADNARDFGSFVRTHYPAIAYAIESGNNGVGDQTVLKNALRATPEIPDPPGCDVFTHIEGALQELQRLHADANIQIASLQTQLRENNIRLEEARAGHSNAAGRSYRITSDPTAFTGEEKDIAKRQVEFLNFESQLKRIFAADSSIFHSDFLKLSHIPGLLEGEARYHYREAFDKVTANPTDPSKWDWKTVDECLKVLRAQYVTLDLSLAAGRAFDNLFMGDTPFQNFITELATLGSRCGKTPEQMVEALRLKVSSGLSNQIKANTNRPEKSDYAGWVALYQFLYNNLEEAKHYDALRKARTSNNPGNSNSSRGGGNSTNQRRGGGGGNQQNQHQHQQNPALILHPAGDPMDLSRADIGINQCAYCKQEGHWRDQCPNRTTEASRWTDTPASRSTPPAGCGRGGPRAARGRGSPPAPRGGFPPASAAPPQYQNFTTAQPQQRFNNQWGTNPYRTGPQLRQMDQTPGYAWSLPETIDYNAENFTIPPTGPGPSGPAASIPATTGTQYASEAWNWDTYGQGQQPAKNT